MSKTRIRGYWLKKTDRWFILPAIELTYHNEKDLGLRSLTLEILFLKRWVAIEILHQSNL